MEAKTGGGEWRVWVATVHEGHQDNGPKGSQY